MFPPYPSSVALKIWDDVIRMPCTLLNTWLFFNRCSDCTVLLHVSFIKLRLVQYELLSEKRWFGKFSPHTLCAHVACHTYRHTDASRCAYATHLFCSPSRTGSTSIWSGTSPSTAASRTSGCRLTNCGSRTCSCTTGKEGLTLDHSLSQQSGGGFICVANPDAVGSTHY